MDSFSACSCAWDMVSIKEYLWNECMVRWMDNGSVSLEAMLQESHPTLPLA